MARKKKRKLGLKVLRKAVAVDACYGSPEHLKANKKLWDWLRSHDDA